MCIILLVLQLYCIQTEEEIKEWKKREKLAKLSYFHPNHQRNTLQKPDNLDNVSKDQLPRVYQLLNTLYTLFEKFGETIPQPFTISIGSDKVRFEIIESKDKITHILTPAEFFYMFVQFSSCVGIEFYEFLIDFCYFFFG